VTLSCRAGACEYVSESEILRESEKESEGEGEVRWVGLGWGWVVWYCERVCASNARARAGVYVCVWD